MPLYKGRVFAAGRRVEHILGTARPVRAHTFAVLTTQQLADGGIENFPCEVPEGDLNSTDRGYGRPSGCSRATREAHHFVIERLDIKWILAYDERSEVA